MTKKMPQNKSKEIILFGRLGNKDNDIKYLKKYLPLNIKKIIEPFGGTFSIIRNIYNDYNKYKLYVNDNDEEIYKIYLNPQKYMDMCIEFNNYIYDECKIENTKSYDTKKFLEYQKNSNHDELFKSYYIKTKIIRGNLLKHTKSTNYGNIIDLMNNINFSSLDYIEIIKQFYMDNDAFIFLDPPYLFSDNSQYSKQQRKEGNDMTDMLYEIKKFFDDPQTKAKIMLIINDMKIIRYLYNDYIIGSYDKVYQLGKRKSTHLIICNFTI